MRKRKTIQHKNFYNLSAFTDRIAEYERIRMFTENFLLALHALITKQGYVPVVSSGIPSEISYLANKVWKDVDILIKEKESLENKQ